MQEVTGGEGGAAVGRPSYPLEACGLHRRFGPTLALAGVDLLVRQGEAVALLGPNGSGKTTLLELTAGLQRPDRGRVTVCGAPAGSLAARREAAFIPGDAAGFEELTVAEYAALLRSLYRSGAGAVRRLEALLVLLRVDDRREAHLGGLSAGLCRRAVLAATLALGTQLVLLDEATAALDPPSMVALASTVRARSRMGLSTLLATQDSGFARACCDQVVVLDRGVVIDAAPAAVVRPSALEEAFRAERSARAAAR